MFFIFGFGLVTLAASIIDAIKYLLMSNDEFNRLYNPGEPFITPEEKSSVRLSYLISGTTPNPLNLDQINQSEQSRTGSAHDTISTLRELKSLYDDGIITASEYEQKRKKLLDSM